MSTGHYLEQLQLSEMMDGLDRLFAGYNWQLGGLFEKILSGNIKEAFLLVYREVTGSLLHQLTGFRGILTAVLLLGILSVFVSGFIAGFENHQIADIAHYIFYLLLLAILLKLFSECYETALQTLSSLVLFSRLVLPALCLSAGPQRAQ